MTMNVNYSVEVLWKKTQCSWVRTICLSRERQVDAGSRELLQYLCDRGKHSFLHRDICTPLWQWQISDTSTASVLSGQFRAELTACSHPDLLCQQKDLTQVGAWPSWTYHYPLWGRRRKRGQGQGWGKVCHEGWFILGSADRMGPARYEVFPAGSHAEYSVTIWQCHLEL